MRSSSKKTAWPDSKLRLILASASPRRRELLAGMGIQFRVEISQADEDHAPYLSPAEIARSNAWRKARAVSRLFPREIVLGADTVVSLENQIFGKPRDLAEAEWMLGQLRGRVHQVITGVCLLRGDPPFQRLFHDLTHVRFHALDDQQVRGYLGCIDPLDKAGAYAIQEHGDQLVASLEGSLSNVIGLPTEKLGQQLAGL
ncbi:MAG TPA: Maf family protein [Candidatus Paceibacterota bacterium]|nr:Maf family protein [Verrucomicrobiota bacterium]HRY47424.1 Maf family protein [Candidatus Paceibacterota bacterium]HSA00315.1 Maf family protein [Candidatus Paceibacterota bacterium]